MCGSEFQQGIEVFVSNLPSQVFQFLPDNAGISSCFWFLILTCLLFHVVYPVFLFSFYSMYIFFILTLYLLHLFSPSFSHNFPFRDCPYFLLAHCLFSLSLSLIYPFYFSVCLYDFTFILLFIPSHGLSDDCTNLFPILFTFLCNYLLSISLKHYIHCTSSYASLSAYM